MSSNLYDSLEPIAFFRKITQTVPVPKLLQQEAQLSMTNRAMLVSKVVEVWQDFLSEYVDKKFTYIMLSMNESIIAAKIV